MSDLSRKEFEIEVAKAFAGYCQESLEEWIEYAKDVLHNHLEFEGIEFGDDEYAWDTFAAHEIVSEDISYWEFS